MAVLRYILLWLYCGVVVFACKKEPAIAELVTANGQVDRQVGSAEWTTAPIGTKFERGDAVRTAKQATAELEIAAGAKVTMDPETILRFIGTGSTNELSVEAGTIELSGLGDYPLREIGELVLDGKGRARITAGGTITLTDGEGKVRTIKGAQLTLSLNEETKLDDAKNDAGVPVDATVAAVADAQVIDAPPAPPASEASIEVTGKRVQIQLAGKTEWTTLDEGKSDLPRGAKVDVKGNSTATLTARDTTLALAGGAVAAVGDDYTFTLERGAGKMAITGSGAVAVAGGTVSMKGTQQVPAEARLSGEGGGTVVTALRGIAGLRGSIGSEFVLQRGERATVLRDGRIRPLLSNPTTFDFRIKAGETFTIHDPKPPTALQIGFDGKCTDGGIVELDKDPLFRTARVSAGTESANHFVPPGTWRYRLRCTKGNSEGAAVANGVVAVVADAGTRPLPTIVPVNRFEPDGQKWTIEFPSIIPDLKVTVPGSGQFKLHLARGGKTQDFDSASPTFIVPGSALTEGIYTYWYDRDGVRQGSDKPAYLSLVFDQKAAQVYIDKPVNGKPWDATITVLGAVLPGWTAGIEGQTVGLDRARRFTISTGRPAGTALAIRLVHPKLGVHYYLRREK